MTITSERNRTTKRTHTRDCSNNIEVLNGNGITPDQHRRDVLRRIWRRKSHAEHVLMQAIMREQREHGECCISYLVHDEAAGSTPAAIHSAIHTLANKGDVHRVGYGRMRLSEAAYEEAIAAEPVASLHKGTVRATALFYADRRNEHGLASAAKAEIASYFGIPSVQSGRHAELIEAGCFEPAGTTGPHNKTRVFKVTLPHEQQQYKKQQSTGRNRRNLLRRIWRRISRHQHMLMQTIMREQRKHGESFLSYDDYGREASIAASVVKGAIHTLIDLGEVERTGRAPMNRFRPALKLSKKAYEEALAVESVAALPTGRQRALCLFYQDRMDENGLASPTHKSIAEYFGLMSTGHVTQAQDQLVEAGWLMCVAGAGKNNKTRTFRLADPRVEQCEPCVDAAGKSDVLCFPDPRSYRNSPEWRRLANRLGETERRVRYELAILASPMGRVTITLCDLAFEVKRPILTTHNALRRLAGDEPIQSRYKDRVPSIHIERKDRSCGSARYTVRLDPPIHIEQPFHRSPRHNVEMREQLVAAGILPRLRQRAPSRSMPQENRPLRGICADVLEAYLGFIDDKGLCFMLDEHMADLFGEVPGSIKRARGLLCNEYRVCERVYGTERIEAAQRAGYSAREISEHPRLPAIRLAPLSHWRAPKRTRATRTMKGGRRSLLWYTVDPSSADLGDRVLLALRKTGCRDGSSGITRQRALELATGKRNCDPDNSTAERLFQRLRAAMLIESKRGRGGRIWLSRKGWEATTAAIPKKNLQP